MASTRAVKVSEEKWLKAELKTAIRRRISLRRQEPELQCTALARTGQPCQHRRFKRPDGTYATVCRTHGGAPPKTPEKQLHALQCFAKNLEARLAGVRHRIAEVEEVIARLATP